MKESSFIAACKEYFGFKPGQSLSEFMIEVRALSDKDKADLIKEFPSVGYQIRA